jgi:hypothetical protein
VEILDANALHLSGHEIVQRVKDADVIGITAMTPAVNSAITIAKKIKGENPESTIIPGGPHATILPEDTLTKVREIDIIVRGEGEITIVELFDALENNKELQHINGITYRDNGIKSTPAQSPIMELNGTVPKSSDINNYIRRRLTLINADATLNQRLENNWKMGPCRCVYRYGKNVHALARVSKRSLPDVLIMISGVQFLLFAVLFDMQESKDKMRGDGARR